VKTKTLIEQSELSRFGKRVRDLRQGRGISQEELAAKANVHRTYIGMVERGEKNVTLLTMLRLADALEVTLQELIEGVEDGK